MCWDVATTTEQIARKDYHCDAADWLLNIGIDEFNFTAEELAIIEKARSEQWKILKGTIYTKTRGKYMGEWSTYKARLDLTHFASSTMFLIIVN